MAFQAYRLVTRRTRHVGYGSFPGDTIDIRVLLLIAILFGQFYLKMFFAVHVVMECVSALLDYHQDVKTF